MTMTAPTSLATPAGLIELPPEAAQAVLADAAGLDLATARPFQQTPVVHRGVTDRVRAALAAHGYALVGGFPVAELGPRAAVAFWRWSSLLGIPILQNLAGQRVDVVRNENTATVRGAKTDRELIFHTDFANSAPDVFGLLTVHQAREGGDSLLSDGAAVVTELRRRDLAAYEELCAPLRLDRTGDVAPDQEQVVRTPVIRYDGERLSLCYNRARIHRGHRVAREPLTRDQTRALDVFDDLLAESAVRLRLARGHAILIDNRRMLHSRTGFTDHDDPRLRRELLRVWLRSGAE
jgi:hypothetical protein